MMLTAFLPANIKLEYTFFSPDRMQGREKRHNNKLTNTQTFKRV